MVESTSTLVGLQVGSRLLLCPSLRTSSTSQLTPPRKSNALSNIFTRGNLLNLFALENYFEFQTLVYSLRKGLFTSTGGFTVHFPSIYLTLVPPLSPLLFTVYTLQDSHYPLIPLQSEFPLPMQEIFTDIHCKLKQKDMDSRSLRPERTQKAAARWLCDDNTFGK